MMAALLKTKQLSFEISPIPKEIDEIKTDRLKLDTILSNIISNAINFTEKGGVKVMVAYDKSNVEI
jgi:signal transduction histidine kinase